MMQQAFTPSLVSVWCYAQLQRAFQQALAHNTVAIDEPSLQDCVIEVILSEPRLHFYVQIQAQRVTLSADAPWQSPALTLRGRSCDALTALRTGTLHGFTAAGCADTAGAVARALGQLHVDSRAWLSESLGAVMGPLVHRGLSQLSGHLHRLWSRFCADQRDFRTIESQPLPPSPQQGDADVR